MSEKIYIDANIFVYAASNNEIHGTKARLFLSKVNNGETEAVTSILTLDEVLWALQKLIGRESAHTITSSLLLFPNLTLVDATKNIIAEALFIYEQQRIQPRDAIHLATMRFKNITTIFTDDSDFDKVQNIKRIKLT